MISAGKILVNEKSVVEIYPDKPQGGILPSAPSTHLPTDTTLMDDTVALMDDLTALMGDPFNREGFPGVGEIESLS